MYFDTRAAKLLKAGEHITVEGCQGLRLEASQTRKSWIYRYKVGVGAAGRMKQVALGQWPAMAPHVAATEWQRLRDARDAGEDPRATKRSEKQLVLGVEMPDPAARTVRQVVEDYISGYLPQHRAVEGLKAAKSALELFLDSNADLASKPAAQLKRADAYAAIEARKATPTAAAKLRSMLGTAWEMALDAGKIVEAPNWWRDVHKGRLKSKGRLVQGEHIGRQRRVLRQRELAVLLPWARENMHAHGCDVMMMYLWTCTRGVEILGMRPEHVAKEQDGWWWTVPKRLTKNARYADAVDLRVPLVGEALEIVRRRVAVVGPSGWLFEGATEGERYEQKEFSTYIYNMQPHAPRVQNRLGDGAVLPVTHWTPHDLRRTGRTLLAAIGCAGEVAEAILGHMPRDIEATYNAYSYDAERRKWLGKLDVYLGKLLPSAGLPARP